MIRYAVEKYKLENGLLRKLIVFRVEGVILQEYSIANKYLLLRKDVLRNIEYYGGQYVNYVVRFLNFLLEYRGLFFDLDFSKVTFSDAQDFLDYFVNEATRTGEEPKTSTRKAIRAGVSRFLANLRDFVDVPDLQRHFIFRKRDERRVEYELTIFRNPSDDCGCTVVRDCPDFFVDCFLTMARRYDPEVYMLASLQINAGLRPSEACNIRRIGSCYGDGYQVVYHENNGKYTPVSLSFDIRRASYKRQLRCDGVRVGGIKRPRVVDVYPAFIQQLLADINDYLAFTSSKELEETMPLVVGKYRYQGIHRAITYNSYQKRFHKLCKEYVFPELVKQGGTKAWYVEKLQCKDFGPHMFREFFTCRLVKMNITWSEIMRLRGDKSEQAAIVYVLKGGAFEDSILRTEQLICEEVRAYGGKIQRGETLPFIV